MTIDISTMIQSVAGNIILAPILIWFMLQYSSLVKLMLDNQKEYIKVLQEVRDTISKCNRQEKLC